MMRSTSIALTIAALSAGCGGPQPAPVPQPPTGVDGMAAAPQPVVDDGPNIGDVEQTIAVEASIAPASRLPQVTVEESRSLTKELHLANAKIGAPAPEQCWVGIKILSRYGGSLRPLAMRARILRDKEVIGSFTSVVSPSWDKGGVVNGQAVGPEGLVFDAFAGLAQLPPTMLVHAEIDTILLPAGADPATIDPATVTGVPADTTTLVSNPLRIDIAAAPAPPA